MAKITQEIIDQIKKQTRSITTLYGEQANLYKRYREMYFMDNGEKPKNAGVDEKDFKVTASPGARNEVIGMKRLLDTSEMHAEIKEGDDTSGNSDKIEKALKKMLTVSSEGKTARVESDAMLSAILYGPVIVYAEAVSDLLAVKNIKPYRKQYLEKMARKTPFLIRTINPEESFIEREDGQVVLHVWKSKVRGTKLAMKWGVKCTDREYDVYDVFTPEYHLVWADGLDGVLLSREHLLGCVPIFSAVAGGSELFHKPEEQINSFLYAKAKGNLDKRENSLLTTIFTNIHMRGLLGPLVSINPATAPETIEINYQGGIRTIIADARPIDDKVIDPSLMAVNELLKELSGESTIYKQALGQNVPSSTFSGLAMLASSGKLPMVDAQRALENAFKDCFEHILYRIKTDAMPNPLIQPMDIPEDYELSVTFKPNLPQDNLRNAQIAQSLGGLVSDEWKYQELLQVGDAGAMRKQIAKEQMVAALLQKMVTDPQFMGEMMQKVMGMKPPAPQPMPQQPQQGMEQMPPELGGGMNMEQTPMTGPMTPPAERM